MGVIPAPSVNFAAILPELVCVAGVFLLMILDVFDVIRTRHQRAMLSGAVLGVALLATVWVGGSGDAVTFGGMVRSDLFANFCRMIFLATAILTVLLSARYVEFNHIGSAEYYALVIFATIGMMVMAAAGDFITFYIGLELMSIAIYVMAGFMKDQLKSNEAGFKYFLLGSFASALLLYGISVFYGATGYTDFKHVNDMLLLQDGGNRFLILGLILLTVGFGFKVAAVPFHMWTPDVYEGAPTPITAFMSVGPKVAAIAVIIRVYLHSGVVSMVEDWLPLLWLLSALSMIVGNVTAVVQDNVKRMLGYSSIAHAGYLLIGVVAAGSALKAGDTALADDSISGVLIYMFAYMFMNIGAFGVIILLGDESNPREHISDYAGLVRQRPMIAILMTVLLLSLAGIPPTFGFVGKMKIFYTAMNAGPLTVWLGVLGMATSVVGAFYYLRVVVYMFMREPEEGGELPVLLPHVDVFAVIFATVATLVLGVLPTFILELAKNAVPQ